MDIAAQLSSGKVLILDGATGTELQRRGIDTRLPLWSADALIRAPEAVRAIHADYINAGANLITTNTFRTHRRSLAKTALGHRARELTQLAVHLVKEAIPSAAKGRVWIAGSMSPLEDCYSPHLTPPDSELQEEHAEMAEHLAEAGADVLLVETMNTIREGCIAAEAAGRTGLPILVSFTCSWEDGATRLHSGEPLADAVRAADSYEPAAIMVNCVPVDRVSSLLDGLGQATKRSIGVYANIGNIDDEVGWTLTDAVTPDQYAVKAQTWAKAGARIIGGCCGSTPEHIAALKRVLG